MKRKKIFLAIILSFVMVWMLNTSAYAGKKEMTLEQKVQRALDYMEIQNVVAKHCYYYAAQEQWKELDTAWSKRDDISYGHNNGYHYGREAVRNYYGKMNDEKREKTLEMISKNYSGVENVPENLGIGALVIHPFTTPYVEIARDGKTAKGVWVSPGFSGKARADGKAQYNSFWERFGVDFIKEDGEWKIWHLQIYTDVIMQDVWDGAVRPGGKQDGTVQVQGPAMNRIVDMYETHSPTTVPKQLPKLPDPYETWKDTTPYIK